MTTVLLQRAPSTVVFSTDLQAQAALKEGFQHKKDKKPRLVSQETELLPSPNVGRTSGQLLGWCKLTQLQLTPN